MACGRINCNVNLDCEVAMKILKVLFMVAVGVLCIAGCGDGDAKPKGDRVIEDVVRAKALEVMDSEYAEDNIVNSNEVLDILRDDTELELVCWVTGKIDMIRKSDNKRDIEGWTIALVCNKWEDPTNLKSWYVVRFRRWDWREEGPRDLRKWRDTFPWTFFEIMKEIKERNLERIPDECKPRIQLSTKVPVSEKEWNEKTWGAALFAFQSLLWTYDIEDDTWIPLSGSEGKWGKVRSIVEPTTGFECIRVINWMWEQRRGTEELRYVQWKAMVRYVGREGGDLEDRNNWELVCPIAKVEDPLAKPDKPVFTKSRKGK